MLLFEKVNKAHAVITGLCASIVILMSFGSLGCGLQWIYLGGHGIWSGLPVSTVNKNDLFFQFNLYSSNTIIETF